LTVSNLSNNSASQIKKKQRPPFYPRVQNLTEIGFTKEELKLLYLGFLYNIEKPPTIYFASPVTEPENAIKVLEAKYNNEDIKKLKNK
jgi:hypothetical protein